MMVSVNFVTKEKEVNKNHFQDILKFKKRLK